MNILVTYDIDTTSEQGESRLRRVARICGNYGQRVQNSVFECDVTEVQFIILKNELQVVIDEKQDNIRIYHLSKIKSNCIETFGKTTSYDVNDVFIL